MTNNVSVGVSISTPVMNPCFKKHSNRNVCIIGGRLGLFLGSGR